MCEHKFAAKTIPFEHPLTDPPNPASHGGVCVVETCELCGLRRRCNVNGPNFEQEDGSIRGDAPLTRPKLTRVVSHDRMSNSGYHRGGKPNWWLRRSTGEFLKIPWVRGDKIFDEELELSTGVYTLGVGKGRDGVRTKILVG